MLAYGLLTPNSSIIPAIPTAGVLEAFFFFFNCLSKVGKDLKIFFFSQCTREGEILNQFFQLFIEEGRENKIMPVKICQNII